MFDSLEVKVLGAYTCTFIWCWMSGAAASSAGASPREARQRSLPSSSRTPAERVTSIPKGLVLHSDNGKPMRASTFIATLQWLGVIPSFSRPHVSDDNPYSEALFRTLKHTPAYPRLPFESLAGAQRWMARFAAWYNGEHRHSAIRYVTPDERHYGREKEILARRQRVYERARQTNPGRWTGATRNWAPVLSVTLNPAGVSEVVNT